MVLPSFGWTADHDPLDEQQSLKKCLLSPFWKLDLKVVMFDGIAYHDREQ
jgi:hypothetical protein